MQLYLTLFPALLVVGAAWMGLSGTNAQAALAKQRLINDENPLIARVGVMWRPGPKWIRPRHSKAWTLAEAELMMNSEAWTRYQLLCFELRAWNNIESAVALTLVASGLGVVASIVALVQGGVS
jgi:hypothetical protein